MIRFLLLLAAFVSGVPAFAADPAPKKITYVESTLSNVSDILFKKGILKTDDPAALEEYLRIHYCGLYDQYAKDEFAWARIRESVGRDLDLRLQDVPDGLEISNAITLDQYDMSTGQFLISSGNLMKNVGLISLLKERTGNLRPCPGPGSASGAFVPRVHPLMLTLRLDTPITMLSIPMSRKAADELIKEMNSRPDEGTNSQRQVIVTMRVRVTGPDPLAVSTDLMNRTILGQIDELRVYEGPARRILIHKKDFAGLRASSGSN